MEKRKKILIADADSEFRSALRTVLQNEDDMEVVGVTDDGAEAVRLAKECEPDVLVMDLVLNRLDGLAVLDGVANLPLRTLVLSSFLQETLSQQVADRGGDYQMLKPCRFSAIVDRIVTLAYQSWSASLLPQPDLTDQPSLEQSISHIFRSIGIPAHLKGYEQLRTAILLSLRDPSLPASITKGVYPAVAEHHGTTSTRVERSIRNAIETAWGRGDMEAIQQYFGSTISGIKGKPTNSEFIATLVDHLRLQQKCGAVGR